MLATKRGQHQHLSIILSTSDGLVVDIVDGGIDGGMEGGIEGGMGEEWTDDCTE